MDPRDVESGEEWERDGDEEEEGKGGEEEEYAVQMERSWHPRFYSSRGIGCRVCGELADSLSRDEDGDGEKAGNVSESLAERRSLSVSL